MQELTPIERIKRTLEHRDIDRIGAFETFWPETTEKWISEGHLNEGENPRDHFKLDMQELWAFNYVADLDFREEILEETEDTKLVYNGNGAKLRWHKKHSGTPEHVDFTVKDRTNWEKIARPHLLNEKDYKRRIKFDEYRAMREKCAENNVFFVWCGVNVFEQMHPVCGHENMLVGMALDPEWVKDMCGVYSDLNIRLMEILFAEAGKPDGIWFYEDMGFKLKPFMSPAMYRDIIMPAHKKTFDYAHSLGLPVFVHSCGFIEPLVPHMIEAGMDALQAMEVKAGMDMLRLKKLYGEKITLIGGLDIRKQITNDRAVIKSYLEEKLPPAMKGSGYVLHSDHSIPDQVEYETYRYFLEKGRETGTYPA